MDDTTFKLLTSFIVKGRKIAGSIDSDKLLKDAGYARDVFRKIEDEGDEDLVMLSLKLRDQLGLLPASAPESPKDESDASRYVLGARS